MMQYASDYLEENIFEEETNNIKKINLNIHNLTILNITHQGKIKLNIDL